ncbi:GCN5 family acetyltransferase [Chlorella sorokiniana]|uniref:GCN5 family acetyltransferase n=1 Tax=Chlorella sorokiniana TaxID=3076 RepID=A0A2P6TXP6_CHLSO|nr:GCN5 family acetyltransferase [Chlorella sorokiniana]|eukprot:PRW58818.1 GCN5 family acetyltransferase [Chlorella sorokiniana]
MLRQWLDERGYWAPGRGAPHSHHFMEKGGSKFLIPSDAAEEFHAILAADLAAGVRHCVSEAHTVPAYRLALDLDCRSRKPLPPGQLLQLCAALHLVVRAFYFGHDASSTGSSDSTSTGAGASSSSFSVGSLASGAGLAAASAAEPTVLALNTAGARPQADGTLLTGAHIIFPGIVTTSASALACRAGVVAALQVLPAAQLLCNGLEAAVDEAVLLERAGLRMVGTYKLPTVEGVYLPTHLLYPASNGAGSGSDLATAATAAAAAAQRVHVALDDAAELAAWMQRTSVRVHGEEWELTQPAALGMLPEGQA